MNYTQRIEAFSRLGDTLKKINPELPVFQEAYLKNNWFTIDMQIKAIHAWADMLSTQKLHAWLDSYQLADPGEPGKVAIIMAGNIPLVGFHDLLCVLITGNTAIIKLSSDDQVLMKWIITLLLETEPGFASNILFADERQLKGFDAVIATGSNNSNRYFEYYFRNKPGILRRNRNSFAVLSGNETSEELDKLADDVFLYFGLGCRNVSKVFLPHGYNLEPMFEAFERYKDIINHNKYANNYTYHKAIFLMNQTPHLDNGFVLLKQDKSISAPLSVLLFDFYESEAELKGFVEQYKNEIQCMVGKADIISMLPFGKSQLPELSDYADGVDTIAFLKGIQLN